MCSKNLVEKHQVLTVSVARSSIFKKVEKRRECCNKLYNTASLENASIQMHFNNNSHPCILSRHLLTERLICEIWNTRSRSSDTCPIPRALQIIAKLTRFDRLQVTFVTPRSRDLASVCFFTSRSKCKLSRRCHILSFKLPFCNLRWCSHVALIFNFRIHLPVWFDSQKLISLA